MPCNCDWSCNCYTEALTAEKQLNTIAVEELLISQRKSIAKSKYSKYFIEEPRKFSAFTLLTGCTVSSIVGYLIAYHRR
jgi:hypothetical protein